MIKKCQNCKYWELTIIVTGCFKCKKGIICSGKPSDTCDNFKYAKKPKSPSLDYILGLTGDYYGKEDTV